jgi:tetratricopeptide (TPR) repeat protein
VTAEPSPTSIEHAAQALPRWALLGVLAVVAGTYLPTLRFGFVYDDHWTLVANGFLREPSWGALFDARGASMNVVDAFRPTSVAFDVLTYRLFGLSALAHHAVSIVLHLGVCAALAAWLRAMRAPRSLQLGAAGLFGVMAIHAEVVALVSFREDLLAAGASLVAMALASTAIRERRRSTERVVAAMGLMALAAGAKLSAATMPLAWAAFEWWSPFDDDRSNRRRFMIGAVAFGLAVGVGLAVAQRWAVFGSLSPYAAGPGNPPNPRVLATRVGLLPVLAASLPIHLEYLRQMIVPLGLSPEYTDVARAWGDPQVTISAFLLLFTALLGLGTALEGRRLVGAVLVCTLLAALPTSNVIGIPNMRADRYMYLPSVPVAVGLTAALLELGERRFLRAPLAPLVGVAVLQGSFAIAASAPYRSNVTLWETAAARAPDSARAHAMLGLQRVAAAGARLRSDPAAVAEIRGECEYARRLDPVYELPRLCHARLDAALGQWDAAVRHLEEALRVSPDRNSRIYAILAQVARDSARAGGGDRVAARQVSARWLDEGLRRYPFSPDLHAVAGRLAHRDGNAEAARYHYERARSLRPERSEVVAWQVELSLDLGQIPQAFETWRREARVLARLDPPERDRLRRRLRQARRWQED